MFERQWHYVLLVSIEQDGWLWKEELALSFAPTEARSVCTSRQRFFWALLIFWRVASDIFLPLFHGLRPLAAGTAFDASCHRMKALGTNRSRRNKAMNAGVHTDTIFA